MDKTPIQKAIEACGGQKNLASAISVAPALVWQWANAVRPVASKHCIAIEAATGGLVTRYDLSPDVFGAPPATKPHRQKTTSVTRRAG